MCAVILMPPLEPLPRFHSEGKRCESQITCFEEIILCTHMKTMQGIHTSDRFQQIHKNFAKNSNKFKNITGVCVAEELIIV